MAFSTSTFPPIRSVLGIVDGLGNLPPSGGVGDAWYEESAGVLWVWEAEQERWCDLALARGRLEPDSPPASGGEQSGALSESLLLERLRKLSPPGAAEVVEFIEFLLAKERREAARTEFLDGMDRQRAAGLPQLSEELIAAEIAAARAGSEATGGA